MWWLLLIVLISLSDAGHGDDNIAVAHDLSLDYPPGSTYMGAQLLGTVSLDAVDVDGRFRLSGLSALGYDQDDDVLYALSDRGVLFHLKVGFDDQILSKVHVLGAYALRDHQGRPLTGAMADGEGLALRHARNGVQGDSELLVSFERYPRVIRFDPSGHPHGAIALPSGLSTRERYQSANRGLEAITVHPTVGVLVGPERPITAHQPPRVELFSAESHRVWWYPQPLEPNLALVAMEALPDGRLLVLERAHGFFYIPFITLLRVLPQPSEHGGAITNTQVAVRMSTGQGFALDNFEGLTRHRDDYFFLVSDDNGQAYQSTLLSYLRLTFEASDVSDGNASTSMSPTQAVE